MRVNLSLLSFVHVCVLRTQELEKERLRFDGMLEIHKSKGEELEGELQVFRSKWTELQNKMKDVEVS